MNQVLAITVLALTGAPTDGTEPGTPAVDPTPPTISSSIEPQEIRIGERVRFEITASHGGDRVFRMPDALDFGAFELVDKEALGTSAPDDQGRVSQRFAFELTLFRPGEARLPDLVLPYVDSRGREFAVTARGGIVKCTSVIANLSAPELKPPPPPVPVIVEDRRLVYAAGLVALLAISWLVAFIVARRLRGPAPAPPPPPPVPPEIIARGRLATLKARDLLRKGLIKQFYLEISHILREYFGNRFAVNGLEMTSDELLAYLSDKRLRGVPRTTVEQFLGESDLVKFARYRPTDDEIAEVFRIAEEIIDCTTPRADVGRSPVPINTPAVTP